MTRPGSGQAPEASVAPRLVVAHARSRFPDFERSSALRMIFLRSEWQSLRSEWLPELELRTGERAGKVY
jgi:hypothetical protein